jgi:hypothetical protein
MSQQESLNWTGCFLVLLGHAECVEARFLIVGVR